MQVKQVFMVDFNEFADKVARVSNLYHNDVIDALAYNNSHIENREMFVVYADEYKSYFTEAISTYTDNPEVLTAVLKVAAELFSKYPKIYFVWE